MGKPKDMPQEVWDVAGEIASAEYHSHAQHRNEIALAIMAAKQDERQVFVEMIEQFGSAKLIRHCRAALSNSERMDR